jgi:vitamin K-dependent gamma-carboxylase
MDNKKSREPNRPEASPICGVWQNLTRLLSSPVDGASLGVFRICFGVIMMLEALTLLRPSESASGKVPIEIYYTGSDINFSFQYEGFAWLPLFPAPVIYGIVALLALSGLTLALGLFYRISTVSVFLTWGYLFAVESTRTYWMSHYYLVVLCSFLLIWMPGARRYSIGGKSVEQTRVPFWNLLLLRGQLIIAYFYAGFAKLNADWMLDAEPVRYFLSRPHVTTPFDFVNAIIGAKAFAYFIAWAGAAFDLSVGFLLIFRKTRILGMVLMLVFHGTNHFLIFEDIGWFPLLGVTTSLIFFEPDWPDRLMTKFGYQPNYKKPKVAIANEPFQIGRIVPPFVAFWLIWQIVFPLRHFLIPGDARFTFEGLRFSWRLKAEVYRSSALEIRVSDTDLFEKNENGSMTLNWDKWQGERVIYRGTDPNEIDWNQLPEIVALYEPLIGERILYNPYAKSQNGKAKTQMESYQRAQQVWQELYGRRPESFKGTIPLKSIIDGYAQALGQNGFQPGDDRQALLNTIVRKHGRDGDGTMIPILRKMYPFELSGVPPKETPFLLIEDATLIPQPPSELMRIDRDAWRAGPATESLAGRKYKHSGREPLVLHTQKYKFENKTIFPKNCVIDSLVDADMEPYIPWDYMQDVTISKAMHISTQPFLLRRYARRIAEAWERKHGNRPSVYAFTSVSLTGRPLQQIVDPTVDLATVPVFWMRHNSWIKDLELNRIPRDNPLPDFLGK